MRTVGASEGCEQEVIRVASHTMTTYEHPTAGRALETDSPRREERLRALALEQIYRVRRFKLHLAAFAIGVPALGDPTQVTGAARRLRHRRRILGSATRRSSTAGRD